MECLDSEKAIDRFRAYLRFETFGGNCNEACVQFLKECCDLFGFDANVVTLKPGFPILYLVWPGEDKELSGVVLNSHYDVVPADPHYWTYPPFSAEMNDKGDIFARGTQDMKCVGMQYLEALARLKNRGFKPKRTIYTLFVPDEEKGGENGMKVFHNSDAFKSWKVGFVLDEGLANPTEKFFVFNGERSIRILRIEFKGNTGHGSRFIENSVGEKVSKFLQIMYKYRSEQEALLKSGGQCISLGEVSTVNLTGAKSGMAYNIVPPDFEILVDFRLATDVQISEFESMLDGWVEQSGPDVSWKYHLPNTVMSEHSKTELSTETNVYWRSFLTSCKSLNIETELRTFPAASDSRYLRLLGYDCIGFSPMNRTPTLLHDNDEFINKNIYLRGVEIYEKIIADLSMC